MSWFQLHQVLHILMLSGVICGPVIFLIGLSPRIKGDQHLLGAALFVLGAAAWVGGHWNDDLHSPEVTLTGRIVATNKYNSRSGHYWTIVLQADDHRTGELSWSFLRLTPTVGDTVAVTVLQWDESATDSMRILSGRYTNHSVNVGKSTWFYGLLMAACLGLCIFYLFWWRLGIVRSRPKAVYPAVTA